MEKRQGHPLLITVWVVRNFIGTAKLGRSNPYAVSLIDADVRTPIHVRQLNQLQQRKNNSIPGFRNWSSLATVPTKLNCSEDEHGNAGLRNLSID